jgi:transposase
METNSKLQELKDLIEVVFEDCDKYSHPHVCNMISDPATKTELENTIIGIIRQSGVSIQAAIDQIERAYNSNYIED